MIRRLIRLALAGSLIYLLWPYNVLVLRRHNPRTTALIQLRKKEARASHRKLKPQITWMPLNQISTHLVHAVLLAEDDTFYQHHGFDFEQIQIALAENLQKQKFAYGGSTITQQLARTLYLRPRKSILRKLKEAILTVYLEATLSKKRILELYLNVVEWGPGIFGAEAAAQYYFRKPASELTPDEAVALASILPSPRRWSPFSEKAFMARRRTQLIERMQKAGYAPITFLDGDPAAPYLSEEAAPVGSNASPTRAAPLPVDPDALAEPPHPKSDLPASE
jgi:monofunctional biosynthetic peptidoglycan transglycosylase